MSKKEKIRAKKKSKEKNEKLKHKQLKQRWKRNEKPKFEVADDRQAPNFAMNLNNVH
ncbi:MAG TPA: hypothetical protein VK209_10935 [Candidatus Sulfotelmatobacter sp.]|nr:hypothetical protein [Candidatus Sulfotelmatobacter sp.]